MEAIPINVVWRRIREKQRKELDRIIELDWRIKTQFFVSDLLGAIHAGKKRHQRQRRLAESWWKRNAERFWTILEGACKLILKIL